MLSDKEIIEVVAWHLIRKGSSDSPPPGLCAVGPPALKDSAVFVDAVTGRIGGPPTNDYLHSPTTLHVSLVQGTVADWENATFKVVRGDQTKPPVPGKRMTPAKPRLICWNQLSG